MKENIFKGVLTTICVSLTAYFNIIAIPVLVLAAVMILDYVTGMAAAWNEGVINSKKGIRGIVKKLCYIVVVAVGMCVDWLVFQAVEQVGIQLDFNFYFGLLLAIWLIINELTSILENLSKMGVPFPDWIKKIAGRLKASVDDKADIE